MRIHSPNFDGDETTKYLMFLSSISFPRSCVVMTITFLWWMMFSFILMWPRPCSVFLLVVFFVCFWSWLGRSAIGAYRWIRRRVSPTFVLGTAAFVIVARISVVIVSIVVVLVIFRVVLVVIPGFLLGIFCWRWWMLRWCWTVTLLWTVRPVRGKDTQITNTLQQCTHCYGRLW